MCSVAVKERISYRSQSLCASGFGKPCDEGAAAVENDLFDRTGSGMGHKNHVWSDLGPPCAGSHGSALCRQCRTFRPFKAGRGRSGAGSRCRSGGPDGIRFRCIDQKYHGSRRCDSFGTHCFSSGGKASYTCTVLSGGRSHHAAGV